MPDYNIWCELVSLLFLLVIINRFFSRRQFPLVSNVVFGDVLLVALADIIFDIVGSLVLKPWFNASSGLIVTVNALYYVVHLTLPMALTTYILALTANREHVPHRIFVFNAVPWILTEILLIWSLFRGSVFTLTEDGFTYGPMSVLPYVSFGIYLASSIGTVAYYKVYRDRNEMLSFVMLYTLLLIAVVIQFIRKDLLLSGTATTLALLLTFFNIQNPDRMTDEATGVFNFSALIRYIGPLLAGGRSFGIALTELTGLRRCNTVYGIAEGTYQLRQIGSFFNRLDGVWSFRIGETRFALLSTDPEAFDRMLEELRENSDRQWPLSSREGSVRFRLNSVFIQDGPVLKDVENATAVISAMPIGDDGSGSVRELNRAGLDRISRAGLLEDVLRDCIPTGKGISIYYQPIYDTETQLFRAAEALLRFNDERTGPVSPAEFVETAENCGLSSALDMTVTRLVFEDIAAGVADIPGLEYVNLNLSAASFADGESTLKILSAMREFGIDPSFVTFEITETAALFTDRYLSDFMDRLRTVGFHFALDDFGNGYSNISRLIALPFDIIKLDRHLINSSPEVFKDLAGIFVKLSRLVVAEGIETAEQEQIAAEADVRYLQGFLYAKPMPPAEFRELVMRQNSASPHLSEFIK